MAGRAVFRKHAAVFGELGTRARFYGLGARFEMVDGDPAHNIAIYKKMAEKDGVNIVFQKLSEGVTGSFQYSKDTIYISTSGASVLNPVNEAESAYKSKFFSSRDARQTYFHEFGHRLFVPKDKPEDPFSSRATKLPVGEWSAIMKRYNEYSEKLTEGQSKIAGRVSKYAQTDKYEFLAEYYSGWTAGRKYDKETTALFHELAGANPWKKS